MNQNPHVFFYIFWLILFVSSRSYSCICNIKNEEKKKVDPLFQGPKMAPEGAVERLPVFGPEMQTWPPGS